MKCEKAIYKRYMDVTHIFRLGGKLYQLFFLILATQFKYTILIDLLCGLTQSILKIDRNSVCVYD